MANLHRGEITISLSGRAYTLRPTFHILCQIEERIGLPIADLQQRLAQKGLLASEILMILTIAAQHDGSDRVDSEAVLGMTEREANLPSLMPAIARFLLAAPISIDWTELLQAAFSLGIKPAQFWDMTMAELAPLLARTVPEPLPMNELAALRVKFPDQRHVN